MYLNKIIFFIVRAIFFKRILILISINVKRNMIILQKNNIILFISKFFNVLKFILKCFRKPENARRAVKDFGGRLKYFGNYTTDEC